MAWLATGVLGVALALLAHDRFLADRDDGPLELPATSPPKAPAPTTASASPRELAADPLATVGLVKLTEDPPDAPVFPGAVRRSAFRRRVPDGAADTFVYITDAGAPAVEDFYRSRMAQAGYTLVTYRPMERRRGGTMTFAKGELQQCSVSLKSTDNGKKVRIALVILRAKRGDG